jgi:hypothetical protein
MESYIFSFSYLDKKKMDEIRINFLSHSLSKKYNLNFLTKKKLNNHFSYKYSLLKNILLGKYLIFSSKLSSNSKDNSFSNILENIEEVQNFMSSFKEDINLFIIIDNDNYYFSDFLKESSRYNNNSLSNLINLSNQLHLVDYLKLELLQYDFFFLRINNFNLLLKNNFINYMY